MMKGENYKIQSGVVMPERYNKNIFKYPFKDMKVGDSFSAGKYSTKLATSVGAVAYHYVKTHGKEIKFSVRKHENEVRCWRIK